MEVHPDMSRKVGTAVIGLGNVGADQHVPLLKDLEEAELVSVCDLDEGLVRQVSSEHDIPGYVDVETMLDQQDLDSVHITTPPQTHVPLTKDVVTHDVAVLIEKPVTTSIEEFDELVEISNQYSQPISVVHNRLFFPSTREALARVERGEIGEITAVTMLFSEPQDLNETPRGEWVYDLPGGEIGEGLVHQVYLPLAFVEGLGEIKNVVRTNFNQYEDPINFDGLGIQAVDSTDRRLITININTHSANKNELIIQGTDGELRLDLIQRNVFSSKTGTSHDVPYSKQFLFGNLYLTGELVQNLIEQLYNFGRRNYHERSGDERAHSHEGHYWLMLDYLKSVQENTSPPVTLEEARDTIKTLEAIKP
jgi:predicted dehydrogenase